MRGLGGAMNDQVGLNFFQKLFNLPAVSDIQIIMLKVAGRFFKPREHRSRITIGAKKIPAKIVINSKNTPPVFVEKADGL